MSERFEVISLGAGVQSSAMALMAKHGIIKPMPECAIFADTQSEPESVYRWLDWLEEELPFPVHRVTGGNLAVDSLNIKKSEKGNLYTQHSLPMFILVRNEWWKDGEKHAMESVGLLQRQCTMDHKITVVRREIKKLKNKRKVNQWMGISLDEIGRIKPSGAGYVENVYPLIEHRYTRNNLLNWMKDNGYPEPPRSACWMCPYHSDAEWLRLKTFDPESFASAVKYEKDFQEVYKKRTSALGITNIPYLHRSLIPLDQVDFIKNRNQINLFTNECEGMCGI